ncbi:MAG TPA: NAD(P)/FAD-dependent oxidoreductase [Acidimicrobiia bacterium]|nr:NAD(P)/FAD-dependent oxidoreductase [Acidimicrobiia bacterium]
MGQPTIEEQLEAIRRAGAARSEPLPPVTILGGGIAGLVAAFELEQLGCEVTLIEARKRTQGRIRTHRFGDGTYGELGPMRIPLHHDATRHYVSLCGLELRPFITAHQNLNGFYDIAGIVTRMSQAPIHLYPAFDLSSNQRQDDIPPKMLGRAVSDVVEGLTDAERESLRSPHLVSDRLRDLDNMTIRSFLEERCGISATELIGLASGLETMFDRSVMMLLRDALISSGEGFDEIVGGMDRLPEALAGKLVRTRVVTGAEVVALRRVATDRLELVLDRQGSISREVAQRVVCTLPFSVLRRLDIENAFSRPKLRAIRELSYMSSTKVLLHTRQRFWELEDGIVGGASQSDRIWRACYYPSDNVAIQQPASPGESRYNTMYGAYEGGVYVARDLEVSKQPAVLLGSYTWGQDARRIGGLPPDDRADVVVRELAAIHPAIAAEGMIDGHVSMFWDTERFTGGSFSEPGPGDHTRLYADTISPDGVVHFAGEHASTDPGWMQGAIISALRAVEEVMAQTATVPP